MAYILGAGFSISWVEPVAFLGVGSVASILIPGPLWEGREHHHASSCVERAGEGAPMSSHSTPGDSKDLASHLLFIGVSQVGVIIGTLQSRALTWEG